MRTMPARAEEAQGLGVRGWLSCQVSLPLEHRMPPPPPPAAPGQLADCSTFYPLRKRFAIQLLLLP